MKKNIIKILFLAFTPILYAQGVGINTTTPSNTSILDIVSTNKGVLLPRLNLSSLTGGSLTTFGLAGSDGQQEGMIVFNTSSTSPYSKGEYIWYNGQWNSFNSIMAATVTAANNGVTLSGTTAQLGGILIAPTSVVANGTNGTFTVTTNASIMRNIVMKITSFW